MFLFYRVAVVLVPCKTSHAKALLYVSIENDCQMEDRKFENDSKREAAMLLTLRKVFGKMLSFGTTLS